MSWFSEVIRWSGERLEDVFIDPFKPPDLPDPPPPPEAPVLEEVDSDADLDAERRRRRSRQATILTRPSDLGEAPILRPTLLGR